MNSLEQFKSDFQKFKSHLLNSQVYSDYLNIDKLLYEDEELVALAMEKQKIELSITHGEEGESIDQKYEKLASIQREMSQIKLVQEYMELRNKIKAITRILEEGIIDYIKKV